MNPQSNTTLRRSLLPVLIAITSVTEAAVTIGFDNFDSSVAGTDYATRTITSGINNSTTTFNIVTRATLQNPSMIDTSTAAGGVVALNATDDLGFLSASKTDNFFGMFRAGATRTLSYTFAITGYDSLALAFDWATSGSSTSRLASISYSIDGGASSSIFTAGTANTTDWTETFDNGTSFLRADSFGTTVNGVTGANLTDVFQNFAPTIAGTGNVLTITVSQSSTVGGTYGGYGLDNLVLSGNVIPEPSSIALIVLGFSGILIRRRR
jgi:hypothetical protein